MMKSNRLSKKRKKNDRTWAEAATLAIQMSPTKVLGIRQILRTIHEKCLKEISMNKAAENVLTTMLNHHAQLPNCPFYRVKGRIGLYALKESWLKQNAEVVPDQQSSDISSDKCEENLENGDAKVSSQSITAETELTNGDVREAHAFSIQGRAVSLDQNKRMGFLNADVYTRNNSLCRNSPPVSSNAKHNPQTQATYNRSRQTTGRQHAAITRSNSFYNIYNSNYSSKNNCSLDLETPSSILVNANMRTLVNRETFAMLPSSYRYKLTTLLPACDQVLSNIADNNQKILVPSETALTNEFFTQAVQEWRERLSDGEFTRETQSRIVQEIAKERSKIDPWKEKFFEEYYGQKQVPSKRLRSRSQNLAAETGHQMRDLGMEAQMALFAHLRPELEKSENSGDSDQEICISDEDLFEISQARKTKTCNKNFHMRTMPVASTFKKNLSYAERIARTKLANSKISKYRTTNSPMGLKKRPVLGTKTSQMRRKDGYSKKSARFSSSAIIMKPSRAFSALVRCAAHDATNRLSEADSLNENRLDLNEDDGDHKILHVRRRSENGSAIADHSYTSALWQEKSSTYSNNNNHTVPSRSSTTLILCPRGDLVNSTIATFQTENFTTKQKNEKQPATAGTVEERSNAQLYPSVSKSQDFGFKVVKTTDTTASSDTERVLSLCARPLTPESFVTGCAKAPNAFMGNIKQAPSPLTLDANVDSPTSISKKEAVKAEVPLSTKDNDSKDISNIFSPLIQPAKMLPSSCYIVKTNPSDSICATSDVQSTCSSSSTTAKETTINKVKQTSAVGMTLLSTTTLHSGTSPIAHTVERAEAPTCVAISVPQSIAPIPQHSKFNTQPPFPIRPSTSQNRPRMNFSPAGNSPLVPGRFSLVGTKRPLAPSPGAFSSPSSPARWSSASNSPPPVKKTRTLAEIKAQMKAKRAAAAAAASVRPPVTSQPHGVVAANSQSHIFNATTFPVYFPMVTDPNTVTPANTIATPLRPNSAAYVRLPNTGTLPLERVQWVSHNDTAVNNQSAAPAFQNTAPMPANITLKKPPTALVDIKTEPKPLVEKHEKLQSSPPGGKPSGKSKITLKIKAAGSAISLKVDADVIKKEMKRSSPLPSSNDDDSSSDDTNSEDSDSGRKLRHAHRGPIRLPRPVSQIRSPDSETSASKSRWVSPELDTGQEKDNGSKNLSISERQTHVLSPALLVKPAPVFGVPPFNVNLKPVTSTESSVGSFATSSLFQSKTLSLFCDKPVSGTWSANKIVADSKFQASKLPTSTLPQKQFGDNSSPKYRSTSKGKNMQDLAASRTRIIHSDSADDDAESSDEEDPADSTISTTTASENDKASDSDDCTRHVTRWEPPQSGATGVVAVPRQTNADSSDEIKPNLPVPPPVVATNKQSTPGS
ncbi:uncharacterized protein LOC143448444 [Clavelina lepadiformis]|uniref:uncharacterized protein LOC143448444 n=1 Tax=Clavelina lepadiformis TaxID=159417 RepID=UPI004041B089